MSKYAGIWLDQKKAHLVILDREEIGIKPSLNESRVCILSGVEKHVRLAGGSRSGKTPYGPQDVAVDGRVDDRRRQQLRSYYREIIHLLQDARRILIFGPGQAKHDLEKEIKKNKSLLSKPLAVETMDKLTERQISAKVKKHFAPYL